MLHAVKQTRTGGGTYTITFVSKDTLTLPHNPGLQGRDASSEMKGERHDEYRIQNFRDIELASPTRLRADCCDDVPDADPLLGIARPGHRRHGYAPHHRSVARPGSLYLGRHRLHSGHDNHDPDCGETL